MLHDILHDFEPLSPLPDIPKHHAPLLAAHLPHHVALYLDLLPQLVYLPIYYAPRYRFYSPRLHFFLLYVQQLGEV